MTSAGARLRRYRILMLSLSAALFGASIADAALAQTGDGVTATGAAVDKLGWWHEKNVATSTPAAIVTVPPPPGVPAETIAVGAVNGEADKIAAIGIVPDAALGATVSTFTLAIKEAEPPAANVSSDAAKITACPITSFWVAAENGTWETRPSFDCDLASAPGTRADDGTWTFDLAPIGQVWFAPDSAVAADGVVLVEDATSPEAFQTVFATSGDGAITVTFSATPGATEDTALDPGSFGDGAATPDFSSGGSIGLDSPSLGLPNLGLEPAVPPTSTPPADEPPAPDRPSAPATIAATSPNVLGNLPPGVVLLAALLLALAGLMTYSLGPAGEPAVATRQRGVSRALAARARAGTDLPTSPETP